MIEPFKYLLQPVAIERNEEGKIVRELPGQTINVFSAAEAAEAVTLFEEQLRQLSAQSNGSEAKEG